MHEQDERTRRPNRTPDECSTVGLRRLLQLAIAAQLKLWTTRLRIAGALGLEDDDTFDDMLNDLVGDYAAGVPDPRTVLDAEELQRLLQAVLAAADACHARTADATHDRGLSVDDDPPDAPIPCG